MMSMQYTKADMDLRDSVYFQFSQNTGKNIGAALDLYIWFQFPPKITNDGRKGKWEEGELPGTEPIAVFETSGSREITLTWTYIVDNSSHPGLPKWNSDTVAEMVKRIRGYFARVRNGADQRALIVRFKMWNHGDDQLMTCRVKNIDVKHSDTIVAPCINGKIKTQKAFPLRTDISIELRIWTEGGPVDDKNAALAALAEKTVDLKGLVSAERPGWY